MSSIFRSSNTWLKYRPGDCDGWSEQSTDDDRWCEETSSSISHQTHWRWLQKCGRWKTHHHSGHQRGSRITVRGKSEDPQSARLRRLAVVLDGEKWMEHALAYDLRYIRVKSILDHIWTKIDPRSWQKILNWQFWYWILLDRWDLFIFYLAE